MSTNPLTCPTCAVPIREHPASRCLDAWICEMVLGWQWLETTLRFSEEKRKALCRPATINEEWQPAQPDTQLFGGWEWSCPYFSTTIAEAYTLAPRLIELGLQEAFGEALAGLEDPNMPGEPMVYLTSTPGGSTVFDVVFAGPLLIARAALMAVVGEKV